MNVLYKAILAESLKRISKDATPDEYCNIWFEVAQEHLNKYQDEGLTETVKELQNIIKVQEKIIIICQ
jgi:hypothetical protein